jgi:hypothetical protein
MVEGAGPKSNFQVDADGSIIGPDGKKLSGKQFRLPKDQGRQSENQAGLPVTGGIDRKPGVGYPSQMDRKKVVRFNGKLGGNNTRLDQGQVAT